jgi:branched-chain amino acid transport system ATP-binding protein
MKKDKVGLVVDDITLAFGGVKAIDRFSIEISEPEILSIIGPNGAGKTCILNCINGFYRPQKGHIFWRNKEITMLPPHKIAQLGIARSFQNLALYNGLSVLENLMAARHMKIRQNMVTGALYFGWARKEEIEHRKRVEEIIDFLEIEAIRSKTVGSLSYGQRKKVDLGRALSLDPDILLLDEPMGGMGTDEKADIARYIIDIHVYRKIPIILVEHDMRVVMDICDRIVVVDFGNKIAEGTPKEISNNHQVIAAYLGKDKEK